MKNICHHASTALWSKSTALIGLALCALQPMQAATRPVTHFRYSGPFVLQRPVMVDTIGIDRKGYKSDNLLGTFVDLTKARQGKEYQGAFAPSDKAATALHLLQFTLTNCRYAKGTLKVGKMKHYKLYVDGKESDGSLTLIPATHDVVIKYLTDPGDHDSLQVSLDTDADALFSTSDNGRRDLTLLDFLNGKHYYGSQVSSDGRYAITTSYETTSANNTSWLYTIYDLRRGTIVRSSDRNLRWMPGKDSYLFTRKGVKGNQLIEADVVTGAEKVLTDNLPEGSWTMAPNGKYLIISKEVEGPKDDSQVHQIIQPDDRQPGWRNRNQLLKYDLSTGYAQPLTFGYHDVSLCDISHDGRYILYMVSRARLSKRPTTVNSVYRLDLNTMQPECLVDSDGFIASAIFSPDARTIAVKGSPESLGGIGENLPKGRIPSMYDYQLYTIDCATRKARPMTKDFDPSIETVQWNRYDGKIYFNALDRDYRRLYRMDPKSGKIETLPTPEDYVGGVDMAETAPVLCYNGQSAMNADRLYTMNTANGKSTLLEDQQTTLADVDLPTCQSWNFTSSRGDTIYGRYYLPPHFDATKKYPMIVYYYGGCSPTSRYFGGNYPFPLYASKGYVVYVIEPSGAAGFGQEFASRHVDTAGDGVADDIIEGTKKFCADHSFVNAKKIGCIGASYGGFMTQYLQTKTDLFAAAVSHAGISDHTQYWGSGYWGYSYSEVSMANRYPWSDRDLYVNHSPLYNADKIHTPLLLVHGTADTNVPTANSIALYTALKLLGRPVALVEVEGENHWIQDYNKRIKWQNTIFAWFAKWLQDDDSWWKAMYDKVPE